VEALFQEVALFLQLVILVSETQDLFLTVPLVFDCLVVVLLVNLHARLQLSGLRLKAHVLLVKRFDFLKVAFGLLLEFVDK